MLIEAAAEQDEELMMKYLDGEELTIEEIKACLAQGYHHTTASFPLPAVLLTATRVSRSCWMPLWTTCPLLWMYPTSRA